jgi:transcriptional regulator with XRE-family HTH domain
MRLNNHDERGANPVTPFGKEIRKLRIDADITLSDMAKGLKKKRTPSYLSAVELGDKPLSDDLVEDIIEYLRALSHFRKHKLDADYLRRVADRTKKTLDIANLNDAEKEAVVGFARRLPALSERKRALLTQKVEEWIGDKDSD